MVDIYFDRGWKLSEETMSAKRSDGSRNAPRPISEYPALLLALSATVIRYLSMRGKEILA